MNPGSMMRESPGEAEVSRRWWLRWLAGGVLVAAGGTGLGIDLARVGVLTDFREAVGSAGRRRTFHVSSTGDDSLDGLSVERAWQSIDRANAEKLLPGDSVLFEGGSVFRGMLRVRGDEAGDPESPLVIGSYGGSSATIETSESAIAIHNTSGVKIRDLVLIGDSRSRRNNGGISLYNSVRGHRSSGVTIDGVEASGFKNGIEIGARHEGCGFEQVTITGSTLHDNLEAGLATYGPEIDTAHPVYAHRSIKIAGVTAYHNHGDPRKNLENSGSGIVLGCVRACTVEWSQAYGNGKDSHAPEGGFGIWAYDSGGVVFQRNVSCDNRTSHADGGGFNIDRNVTSSLIQYNLSYDNDGAGYMAFSELHNGGHANNTFRFNVSVNDSRRATYYGAFTVMGDVRDSCYHNNTVIVLNRDHPKSPVVRLSGQGAEVRSRLDFCNNIFASHSGGPPVFAPSERKPQGIRFLENCYFGSGEYIVEWGRANYRRLSQWRRATGQEIWSGRATGISGDPRLVDPGSPDGVYEPRKLDGFSGILPRSTSPVVGAGLSLDRSLGIEMGDRDFLGDGWTARAPNIGAA